MSQYTPNSFQVPNAFVDEVLHQISDAAAKMYLIICRKTRGWFKEFDSISLSQFQEISGKSRPTVTKALAELIQVGLVIECDSTIHGNSYKLNDECVVGWKMSFPSKNILLGESKASASKKSLPVIVKKFNYASKNILPLLVKNIYTQNTLSKPTIQNKKINKKSASGSEQPKAEKQKAEKPNDFDAKPVELPVNVSRDLWIQFVDMRNEIKKPLTENAVKLILKKLVSYGERANESLEYSIIGNYQGVFQPKSQNVTQTQQPVFDRRRFGSQAGQPKQMRDVHGECA